MISATITTAASGISSSSFKKRLGLFFLVGGLGVEAASAWGSWFIFRVFKG